MMEAVSLHDDISWSALRDIVQRWLGPAADLAEARPLDGGSINNTILLTARGPDGRPGERAVLKITPHRVSRDFEREAHQLDMLREIGLPTPRVHIVNVGSLDDPHSYILMEYVEAVDLGAAKVRCSLEQFDALQAELAELIGKMHSVTGPAYKRVHPSASPTFESWAAFYRGIYDPIVTSAEVSNVLPTKAKKLVARIHDRAERLLAHDDCPRLVHWDIWSNNVLCSCDANGKWKIAAIIDPNCKFAHAEAEIAYIDLFKTATPAFTRTYQQTLRLSDEYHRCRKLVYQLYPLLDHVSLFGAEYLKPTLAALERAAHLV